MAHGGPLKAPVITLGEKKVCLVKKRRPTNTSAIPSTAGRTPPARKAPANPLTASSLKNSSRRSLHPESGGLPHTILHPHLKRDPGNASGTPPSAPPLSTVPSTGPFLNNGSREKASSHGTDSVRNFPGFLPGGVFASSCSFPFPRRYGIRFRPKAFFSTSGLCFMESEFSAG